MSSQRQLARLLALIPYLQAHPGVSITEAAAAFSTTKAQLRSDLGVLWMCGLPGQAGGDLIDVDMDAVEGEGIIKLSNADYLSKPLRLTPDETCGLVLALSYLEHLTDSDLSGAVGSALTKLRATLLDSGLDIAQVHVVTAPTHVRDALGQALTSQHRLRLSYLGQKAYTTPEVDPARIVEVAGVAYLQAWSYERQDWRMYRLERISRAEVLAEPIIDHGQPPPPPNAWADVLPFTSTVTLRVPERLNWVSEYFPVRSTTAGPSGTELELGIVDDEWLARLLLQLGGDVTVLTETQAVSRAEIAAKQALDLYASLS